MAASENWKHTLTPSQDPLRIVLVGHDLQAKCDVGNTIIKQRRGFRQFKCRQSFLVKTIVGGQSAETVAGKQLQVVLTPNLNTPTWTHSAEYAIKRYNHIVFIYVRAPGLVKVKDQNSIENLKQKFKKEVLVVTYYDKTPDPDVRSLNENCLCGDMNRDDKSLFANLVLKQIGRLIPRYAYKGREQVGGRAKEIQRKEEIEMPSGNEYAELEKLMPVQPERTKTNEFQLKDTLDVHDWELFNKTLRCGRAKSNHVRVNFIGNQSAGKSTLVARLQNMDIKCPNNEQCRTEALEVYEILSRCTEIGSKRCWETNIEGFADDLNEQRMAQAMKKVQTELEGTGQDDSEVEELEEIDVFAWGSTVEEDITVVSNQTPFEALQRSKDQPLYLKRVLRKKEHSLGERMYLSYWDFAGQSTYYSTHQIFMSPSAVYVLVVDLSLDLHRNVADNLSFRRGVTVESSVADSLIFWISSIKAFTSDAKGGCAPVIVVGTHLDKMKERAKEEGHNLEKVINERFDAFREILKMSDVGCIAVDNVDPNPNELEALRNRILDLGLAVIDEEIPAQWIDLERRVMKKKLEGKLFMSFTELQTLDKEMDVPINDRTRLEAFLAHQHNRGHLIHFLHDNLKFLIILEPLVMAKFLNKLMRTEDSDGTRAAPHFEKAYNYNGLINRMYILKAAKGLKFEGLQQNVDTLITMLIHLSILRPYTHDGKDMRYLLPCLLPQRMGTVKEAKAETQTFQLAFTDNHCPPQFFHILISGLLNEWKLIETELGKPEIYNQYACFFLDRETQQVEVYWKESCIYVRLVNYSKVKLTNTQTMKVINVVEGQVETIFRIYRHHCTNFEVRCLCPLHDNKYISLRNLVDSGEAMCFHTEQHSVCYEDIFGNKMHMTQQNNFLTHAPTDAQLGRLSLYMNRESVASLASRLRLYFGPIESDGVANVTTDQSIQRLLLLNRWKSYNGACTVRDLIDLLTKTKDYSKTEMIEYLQLEQRFEDYDLADSTLKSEPSDTVLKVVSNNAESKYPFLALELGFTMKDIISAQENYKKQWDILFDLLKQWRHKKQKTTRELLDAAANVGIDMKDLQTQILLA